MRKLMWFTIGFAAALGCCAYLLPEFRLLPLMILTGIAAVVTVCAIRWEWMRRPAAVLLGLTAGYFWFSAYQRHYLLPAMSLNAEEVETTVTAADFGYDTTYGTAVDGHITIEGREYTVRVYLNEKKIISPGDQMEGEFRFCYTGRIGQEEATYHQGQGIVLLGYQSGAVSFLRTLKASARYYPALLADRIRDILRKSFPDDAYPFAKALLLGDSSSISYEVNTAFKISGIRHIIAVSGLHVAILYGMLSMLTFNKRFLTALVALPTLFLFAGVAGFTPSVTRACIMVGLMILSQCFNREYDSPTALAFACLVMLVWNPLVITSVSFQLSVGCVAGILLFNDKIHSYLISRLGNVKGKRISARLKRWFASSVSVTLSAMSLTTPLSAYYFGAVSLIGLLTNLLCLWAVSLIFYGIVAVCVVYLVSTKLAAALGWVIAWIIRYVLIMAKVLSDFPLAAVYTKSFYIVAWLVFVYIMLAVFLLWKERKPMILICCAAFGLCGALMASWLEPLTDECRVTVLDVGQGQSILLQSEGKTFLVDCGGDSDTITADIAAETLLSQGIPRLDGIILTHCDRDHAGAVENLVTRVDADALFLPVTADEETAQLLESKIQGQTVYVESDLELTYGSSKITIFGPIFVSESNENSLCVLFETKNCAILITGDRSAFGERMLLRNAVLPNVDLLIAGHHGSKHSTGAELLDAVKPETVIISVGEDNSYGHPAPELLQRLEDFGCAVYRTDQNGTIVFRR